MRLHRFYVSQPLGEDVVIDDVSLVSQWMKVFRYTIGDFVILFNGDGLQSRYSITTLSKTSCTLLRTKSEASYIPTRKISLYLSLIKKDNFELVVQKATELGVTNIIPVLSERSEKKNLSLERLQKIAIEASEQCGRGDVPKIAEIISLDKAVSLLAPETKGLVFTFDGKSIVSLTGEVKNLDISLFIGPEGGWGTADEALFEKSPLLRCSLGPTVLRAETAAITACALVSLL